MLAFPMVSYGSSRVVSSWLRRSTRRLLAGLFYGKQGFELALAYSTDVEPGACFAEMQRLVTEHDSAAVDELIVSAGAPRQSGFAYPSDAVAAQAVLVEARTKALSAHDVKRIYLYEWSSQSAREFTPNQVGCSTICGPDPITVQPSP